MGFSSRVPHLSSGTAASLAAVGLAALALLLGGCQPPPSSSGEPHKAAARCVKATGSLLCQTEQESDDRLSGTNDPSVQGKTDHPGP